MLHKTRILMKVQTTDSLCSLIHVVHSFGVAFGNLSPFGRLWSIPLISASTFLQKRIACFTTRNHSSLL
jgi:hypothetical protein